MSKQDTHFFNVFSLVIALLVAVTIALFGALAVSVDCRFASAQSIVCL